MKRNLYRLCDTARNERHIGSENIKYIYIYMSDKINKQIEQFINDEDINILFLINYFKNNIKKYLIFYEIFIFH